MIDEWGPAAWKFLHTATFNYPEHPTRKDKENYGAFFRALGPVLPCVKCRVHFAEHFKQYPIDLKDRESLARWLVQVHNAVNRAGGKNEYTFEEAQALYSSRGKKCMHPTVPWLLVGALILFLLKVNSRR